jgi:4-hydroxy-tetrahydrodipicolinate synthase
MSIGAKGVVSVVGNIVPKDMMALVKSFADGNWNESLTWHRKLFPLCRDLLSVATNPIPVKTATKLLGRGNGELRLPMTPLDTAGEAKIAATLKAYGLM